MREPKYGDAPDREPMSREEYKESYGYKPCEDEYREYYRNERDRYL